MVSLLVIPTSFSAWQEYDNLRAQLLFQRPLLGCVPTGEEHCFA